jgi:hypothetical protein
MLTYWQICCPHCEFVPNHTKINLTSSLCVKCRLPVFHLRLAFTCHFLEVQTNISSSLCKTCWIRRKSHRKPMSTSTIPHCRSFRKLHPCKFYNFLCRCKKVSHRIPIEQGSSTVPHPSHLASSCKWDGNLYYSAVWIAEDDRRIVTTSLHQQTWT